MRTKIFSLLTACLLGAASASAQQVWPVGYCADFMCTPTGSVNAQLFGAEELNAGGLVGKYGV